MKIEDFRNTTLVVDLLTSKNNGLLSYDKLYHVVKFREYRFKIVTCRRQTDRQAGRRQWPDPATLYFTPGIAEISKSKIKKKN